MTKNRIIFAGEKESFIIRVLVKKLQDAGFDCEYTFHGIDEIEESWRDAKLICLYMDQGAKPSEALMQYLSDNLIQREARLIPIGEPDEIIYIRTHMSSEVIYKTFSRPVDNEEFMQSIDEFFNKLEAGDFKKHILIVDDDPQYLALIHDWLGDVYKISGVNSGVRAMTFLAKNKVDLILLDHEMPVTSGPKVLEMLRSEPKTQNIPVIFLTGKQDRDSVMQVVNLHPEGYFIKTIQKEELLNKLNEYFALHSH